jgi:hypothetical protein
MSLHSYDLQRIVNLLPRKLVYAMKNETMPKIYIGGGFIRSAITGDKINDIDLFTTSRSAADTLIHHLCEDYEAVTTENATTIKAPIPLQIIHRWTFESMEQVANSFDFTICCAAVTYNRTTKAYISYSHPDYYPDLAARRLTYTRPIRNEDAGGSLIRVLKYYQKGYRTNMSSLAAVVARLIKDIDFTKVDATNEEQVSTILHGLLREVDPNSVPVVD